ncbi:MAG TPA: MBL fold metallo-hydrolase [Saprospiraceae bacterium]|nr:MBL fold metallo-hydrolase [Saprospiraceae bacterium]
MIKLHEIPTGYLKLDGGAMFGVVPKSLWSKINPPDEDNLCTWSMRCLLIETPNRLMLVDTGIGDKQSERFFSYYQPHGADSLHKSIEQAGFTPEQITDVFLTHLHFDHVGGAVRKNEKNELIPVFPNATYWSNEKHYDWAVNPNPREKASFLQENFVPLQRAGVLAFLPTATSRIQWVDGLQVYFVYGHTEAMMLLRIPLGTRHLLYCADLVPSSGHLGASYVMSYDVRPLLTMQEKAIILEEACAAGDILFFEHDPRNACATLTKDDRGRIVTGELLSLDEAIRLSQ